MSRPDPTPPTSRTLKVFILEDNPGDAKLATSLLKRAGYDVQSEVTDSREAFRQRLAEAEFDVIVADFNLRDWTALDALEIVSESGKDIPVVVMTGSIGDEAAVDLIKRGATDYVLKDRKARLPVAIRQAMEEKRLRQEHQKAEAQMRLQSAALESAANSILITDRSGEILWTNPAFTYLTGYSVDEVAGKKPNFLKSGRYDTAFYQHLWETILAGKVWHDELMNRRKDGSLYHEEMTITPVLDKQGAVANFIAIKQDVTERNRTEEKLRRAERALRALSDCNRALVRARAELQLLQDVCAILVGVGGYHFAWVGYAEHDEAKSVRPVAHAGYEDGYLANTQIVWSDTELGQRPSGIAIRTGKPCVVQNVHADPRFVLWSAQARNRGFESTAALPLKLGHQNLGALVIHAQDPNAFDEREMALLTELGEDVAFGIQALRTKAERREAEFALRDSEARFRFLFMGNPLPMWVYDLESLAFLEVNDAAVTHYGYSREDFLKMRITDIRPASEVQLLRENLAQGRPKLEDSGPWRHQLKNGQIILVQITSHLLPWDGRSAALVVAQDITARVRAELALRESEERYRLLFENNLAGVFRTDVDGNILDCNPAMTNMLGAASPREVLTHNVLDFYFSEEDRTKFRADLELAGRVTDCELRLRHKDGSALWVIANINTRVQAGGGGPIIEGTLVNISDRKHAEAALRENEARYRTLFERNLAGIVQTSLDGRILDCNEEYARIIGFASRTEAMGQSVRDIWYDRSEREPWISRVQKEGTLRNVELRLRRRDGRMIWVLQNLSMVDPGGGKEPLCETTLVDITERKAAEEALAHERDLLRALMDNLPEYVFFKDRQSRFVRTNLAHARVLGLANADEAVGKRDFDFFPAADAEMYYCDEQEMMATGEPLTGKVERVLEAGGQDRWCLTTKVPVRDAEGRIAGLVGITRDITEYKRVEDMLRRSQACLAAGERLSHTGSWSWNPATDDLYWSDETYRIFGFDPGNTKASIQRTFLPRIHPEDRLRIEAGLLHPEVQHAEDYRIVLPDASVRHIHDIAYPILDADGRVVERFGVANDVTEQLRAEAEISRLAAIVNSSDDAIYSTDTDGIIITWNPGAERLYGYTAEEIEGKHFTYLIPEERRSEGLAVRDRLFRGEAVVHYEFEHRRKDGSELPLSLTLSPIKDISGVVTGVSAIAHDMSERMRSETALRESEERFRRIAETITEVFWVADPFITRMLYISPAYEQVWGRSVASLYENPRSFIETIHDEDRDRILADLATEKEGLPFEHEYRIARPDGSLRWIWDRGFPVRDEAGHLTTYLGVAQDITERKALQEQLYNAAKMEAVGRLAGGVAHDFNNLLTVMNGYSELLLEVLGADHKASTFLREIKDAGDRAAMLTRQLLAFSRQQVLAPQVLDLNGTITNLAKMLKRLIGEDIFLRTVLGPALGWIKADPGQVEQVIMNLAVNSRDAMPSGGSLTIETSNIELDENYARTHFTVKPGPHVMLAVSDTGTGMSREIQARIFEPFFTTKELGRGTGLGLATVYGIVKQSGGSIWVYSEPGQGTTFKIYFPRVDAPLPRQERSSDGAEHAKGVETILVVEDEDAIRPLVYASLKSRGYEVLEASGAQEALALAKQHSAPIHLLLTDVIMPQMNGKALAERLVPLHPETRVLFMSGYTDDAVIRTGILESSAAFLQKPFTPGTLARKVREVLDTASEDQP